MRSAVIIAFMLNMQRTQAEKNKNKGHSGAQRTRAETLPRPCVCTRVRTGTPPRRHVHRLRLGGARVGSPTAVVICTSCRACINNLILELVHVGNVHGKQNPPLHPAPFAVFPAGLCLIRFAHTALVLDFFCLRQ